MTPNTTPNQTTINQAIEANPLLKPLVYPIPADQPVTTHRDLTYKQADGIDLKMDIYTPAGLASDALLPAVLFIHGGPIAPDTDPLPKDWGVYRSYGELMGASDLVGVTFNHRLYAPENYPKSLEDVRDAIQFIRANSQKFHVDPDRLGLWGFSGGGPLLAFALSESPEYIRCWLAFYAALDMTEDPSGNFSPMETIRQFSARAALDAVGTSSLPMYVARAGLDNADLNIMIDAFVQQARALNKPLTFVNHPSGRHGFDMLDDDEHSREIIAGALAFIKAHLGTTSSTP